MRIAAALLITALALSGCRSKAEKASDEYYLVEKKGITQSEKCDAARKALDAWREAEDDRQYSIWSVTVFNACKAD